MQCTFSKSAPPPTLRISRKQIINGKIYLIGIYFSFFKEYGADSPRA